MDLSGPGLLKLKTNTITKTNTQIETSLFLEIARLFPYHYKEQILYHLQHIHLLLADG